MLHKNASIKLCWKYAFSFKIRYYIIIKRMLQDILETCKFPGSRRCLSVCSSPLLASPVPPLCTVCGVTFIISSFFILQRWAKKWSINCKNFRPVLRVSCLAKEPPFLAHLCTLGKIQERNIDYVSFASFSGTPLRESVNALTAFGAPESFLIPSLKRWKLNGTHATTPFKILDVLDSRMLR